MILVNQTKKRAFPPNHQPILVLDSGQGGQTVLAALRRRLPELHYVYFADEAAFTYGDWEESALKRHLVSLISRLIDQHRPSATVIACNTASTIVLGALRAAFPAHPFVGTVPAIKPAATQTKSGLISVLATPGTVERDYTRALIDTYASHVEVNLVGSPHLAALAEARSAGRAVDDHALLAEIEPAFVTRTGKRTDQIVLGCTHYPLLLDDFVRLAPWPVTWIDPAPAIAERLASLLELTVGGLGKAIYLSSAS